MLKGPRDYDYSAEDESCGDKGNLNFIEICKCNQKTKNAKNILVWLFMVKVVVAGIRGVVGDE